MAKNKRGTALFDLLDVDKPQAAQSLQTPKWWSGGDVNRDPVSPPADPESGPAEPDRPPPVSVPEAPKGPDSSGRLGESGEDVPFLRLEGDRIRCSLTSVSAAVVVFALLVSLLGAYELGRRKAAKHAFAKGYEQGRLYYEAEASSEIEQARRQEPATHVIRGLLEDTSAAGDSVLETRPTSEAGDPPWIPGYTYVVVQEFLTGREDDARRAQAYLSNQGVATELIRFPSGAVQLISRQGYNLSDPTQQALAEKLKSRIHEIGAAYYASGGRYKLQGYFKTHKGPTW